MAIVAALKAIPADDRDHFWSAMYLAHWNWALDGYLNGWISREVHVVELAKFEDSARVLFAERERRALMAELIRSLDAAEHACLRCQLDNRRPSPDERLDGITSHVPNHGLCWGCDGIVRTEEGGVERWLQGETARRESKRQQTKLAEGRATLQQLRRHLRGQDRLPLPESRLVRTSPIS